VSAASAPIVAREPSFDCTKAQSRSERLICEDAELSALDNEFGALYIKAKDLASDKTEFIRENRREWQKRDQTCVDKACLIDWYAQRRLQLSKLIVSSAPLLSGHPSEGCGREPTNPAPPPDEKPRELQVAIEFDGSRRLGVSNVDPFYWKNCRIDINAHGFSYGYSLTVPEIGNPVYLDVTEFATSDGERFSPFERKLLSVDIACDTPNGREHFWGQMAPM
jgi:hypothetical protein